MRLTTDDRRVWSRRPPVRSSIPVLAYHGIAPRERFTTRADAGYGLNPAEFAKQMALLHYGGYHTISLPQFVRYIQSKPVRLPPRPILLTFDDARADSWTGADAVLRQLDFNAVMYVDVGAVARGDREYLTWEELRSIQHGGRWNLQLHAGRGHHNIVYGPAPRDFGPFYAYRQRGETLAAWRRRAFGDLTWGSRQLAAHVPGYRPLSFAPPYGNYGQLSTNDPRIPGDLLRWLRQRYAVVFTQDRSGLNSPGRALPLGRFQLTRRVTGGDLHAFLSGDMQSTGPGR